WISHIGGTGDELGKVVAVDPNGDILVAGTYLYTDATLGGDTLMNHRGFDDLFIAEGARNDRPAGRGKSGGGERGGTVGSLGVDPTSGDVLIAGTFQGSADFGGAVSLMHAGDGDGYYVGRYSGEDGHAIWVKAIDAFYLASISATISPTGDVYLAGSFNGA